MNHYMRHQGAASATRNVQNVDTGYRPRPLQSYIHSRLQRFNVLPLHRRFGKTVLAVNEIVDRGLRCNRKNPQLAYVAPTYGQAERIAWDYFKQYTEQFPGVEYNATKLSIIIPRPAYGDRIKIMLLGAENPDALRGLYLDGVVLDEYGMMAPSIWGLVIRPLLADRSGWALFLGTPSGQNHFYDMYNLGIKFQGQGWFAQKFKASQTGIIPKEELEQIKLEMSEEQYLQEFECDFTAANIGAYWGKAMRKAEAEGRIGKVPHDPSLLVSTYWDLGVSDTTTVWFLQRYRSEFRLIDFLEMSGEGLEYYVKALKEGPRASYNYDMPHNWPHDGKARDLSTGNERSQTMRQLKAPVLVHKRYDVADSINAVRKILPFCYFDEEKCKKGIEALKAYERKWDDKNQIFMDKPNHNWASHGADSFRLLGMAARPGLSDKPRDLPRDAVSDYDVFDPYGQLKRFR